MEILLDIGNSRFKWVDREDISQTSINTSLYDNVDKVNSIVQQFFSARSISNIVCCSVLNDEDNQRLKREFAAKNSCKFTLVNTHKHGWGITVSYADPSTLGADRYVAMIAAHHHYSDAKIIVDCGSAITVDAIVGAGRHLGGMIIPGSNLMFKCLLDETARITQVSDQAKDLLCNNTADAVTSGVVRTLVAGLNSHVSVIKRDLNQDTTVIVTGGDAQVLIPYFEFDFVYDPLLVFKGLAIVVDEE